jgi:hypothetical protein
VDAKLSLYDRRLFRVANRLRAPNKSGVDIAARAVIVVSCGIQDLSLPIRAVSACQAKDKYRVAVEMMDLCFV